MARLPRLVIPFQAHHILQRGNNRQVVFCDNADYQKYLDCLSAAAHEYKVAIHAYVLMPNHVHILASPSDESGLARMMQWIGRHYVPYFNHRYQRVGSLWQGRFRTSLIDSERYFLGCSRYIEHNPVRAMLAVRPDGYLWSSYLHHIGVKVDPLITDHPLYWAMGNTPFAREAAYKDFAEQGLASAELTLYNSAFAKGWPLTSAPFKASLEQRLQRRIGPAKRGRPAKAAVAVSGGAALQRGKPAT